MNFLILYLKGIVMGLCDLVPGISGGTMALVMGIYEQLILSIKTLFMSCCRPKIAKKDFLFLAVLFAGISTAIILGSYPMGFILAAYPALALSFFFGLILASSKVIYDNIVCHTRVNMLFGLVGISIGLLFSLISPMQLEASPPYVFIGGLLAASAMFLPGISGAFVLLVMGLYESLLASLRTFPDSAATVFTFIAGAICGAFAISRLVSFLFSKDRCRTLYVLWGLVIGTLAIPLRRIALSPDWGIETMPYAIAFALAGALLVIAMARKSAKKA
jgi:putative membrane protein